MNPFYLITFVMLAACTALLEFMKSQGSAKPYAGNKGFLGFRNNYIFVYTVMMGMAVALTLALCLAMSAVPPTLAERRGRLTSLGSHPGDCTTAQELRNMRICCLFMSTHIPFLPPQISTDGFLAKCDATQNASQAMSLSRDVCLIAFPHCKGLQMPLLLNRKRHHIVRF